MTRRDWLDLARIVAPLLVTAALAVTAAYVLHRRGIDVPCTVRRYCP